MSPTPCKLVNIVPWEGYKGEPKPCRLHQSQTFLHQMPSTVVGSQEGVLEIYGLQHIQRHKPQPRS